MSEETPAGFGGGEVAAPERPSTKYVEWSSARKRLEYWDKEAQERVPYDMNHVIVLDQLSTVKGWSDADNAGICSTEVRNISTQPMRVWMWTKPRTTEVASGIYSEIKPNLPDGFKFTKSIYVYDPQLDEIVNLQLMGAALSGGGPASDGGWFSFSDSVTNRSLFINHYVMLSDIGKGKRGSVEYNYPIFSWTGNVTSADREKAIEAFNRLEEYLIYYIEQNKEGGEASAGPGKPGPATETPKTAASPSDEELDADDIDYGSSVTETPPLDSRHPKTGEKLHKIAVDSKRFIRLFAWSMCYGGDDGKLVKFARDVIDMADYLGASRREALESYLAEKGISGTVQLDTFSDTAVGVPWDRLTEGDAAELLGGEYINDVIQKTVNKVKAKAKAKTKKLEDELPA